MKKENIYKSPKAKIKFLPNINKNVLYHYMDDEYIQIMERKKAALKTQERKNKLNKILNDETF